MWFKKLFGWSENYDFSKEPLYDRLILMIVFLLLAIGLVVVYTASIAKGEAIFNDSLFFVKKQLLYVLAGLGLSFILVHIPSKILYQLGSTKFLLIAIFLCVVTIFIGAEIKGAKRWLNLGFINFQSAELFKLVWIVFIAGYIERHKNQITNLWQSIKPSILLFLFCIVIGLGQSDFGTCMILITITLALLFVVGVKIKYIFGGGVVVLFFLALLVIIKPHRIQRLLGYLDPWQDSLAGGYQITMSLMAFGRGEIEGKGLGESVFKLEYVPDPHTDFVTAIWAEETGLVGMILILILEFWLVARIFGLGICCLRDEQNRNLMHVSICIGIGLWFLMQVFINIGSATCLIPAKGLTLPLISYGGSSLIMMLVAIAIVIRISYERRVLILRMAEAEKKIGKLRSKKQNRIEKQEEIDEVKEVQEVVKTKKNQKKNSKTNKNSNNSE
jgi:cell division protein FtsW